jgi:hypothetical protein
VSYRAAISLLLVGVAIALVGSTVLELAPEHRLAVAGALFVFALGLVGIDARVNR